MDSINLGKNVGKMVTIKGHVSNIMWQHLMAYNKAYPHNSYFEIPDNNQIVLYSKNPLPNDRELTVTGKVIEVRGSSKRPGERESKVDDTYVEYHLLVDSWTSDSTSKKK
jgi:hypothetical protein